MKWYSAAFDWIIVWFVLTSAGTLQGDHWQGQPVHFNFAPQANTFRDTRPLNDVVRMPGEFERQSFLVLSCGLLTPSYADTMAQISEAARHDIRVLILCADDEQREMMEQTIAQRGGSLQGVCLERVPHDTRWVRDYGPTVLHGEAGFRAIDWTYEDNRPLDEIVPHRLCSMSDTPFETAGIQLPGGNLLSNGQGLCLTTTAIADANREHGREPHQVYEQLGTRIGASQVIVLEPLNGEATGHVDMFTTFVGPNTVVVGQYSAVEDADNADLLDRNAARLANVITPNGRLQVERVPMGKNHDGVFRTYTNCIYANGVLIIPKYRDCDDARLDIATACFRRLLPGWRIVHVDASEMIAEGGSLHCISLNIPGLRHPILPLPAEELPRHRPPILQTQYLADSARWRDPEPEHDWFEALPTSRTQKYLFPPFGDAILMESNDD